MAGCSARRLRWRWNDARLEAKRQLTSQNATLRLALELANKDNLEKDETITDLRSGTDALRQAFRAVGHTGHMLDSVKVILAENAELHQRLAQATATPTPRTTSDPHAAGEHERARQQPARNTTG